MFDYRDLRRTYGIGFEYLWGSNFMASGHAKELNFDFLRFNKFSVSSPRIQTSKMCYDHVKWF